MLFKEKKMKKTSKTICFMEVFFFQIPYIYKVFLKEKKLHRMVGGGGGGLGLALERLQ